MGRLKAWPRETGPSEATDADVKILVIVPGISAKSLEDQTCPHFHKFLTNCCNAAIAHHTAWVYDHELTPDGPNYWKLFCAAGEDLMTHLLTLVQERPRANLVLIGHKLGAFILKRALILAYRNRHDDEVALLDALQTIVMVGDPCLQDSNRKEWTGLIQDCLKCPSKMLRDTFLDVHLDCLKIIDDEFERCVLESQYFQVSGKQPAGKKILRRFRSKSTKNCICDADIMVRVWTTADEDEAVALEGEENLDRCLFHDESPHHDVILSITSGSWTPQSDRLLGQAVQGESAVVSIQVQSSGNSPDQGHGILGAIQPDTGDLSPGQPESHSPIAPSRIISEDNKNGCDIKHAESSTTASVPAEVEQDHEIAGLEYAAALQSRLTLPKIDAAALENASTPFHQPNSRARPLPVQHHVPQRCEHFVGRQKLLKSMNSMLLGQDPVKTGSLISTSQQKKLVLHGLPGIGKTEIALEFTRLHGPEYDAVFWIKADSPSMIAQSFHDVAIALHLVNGRKQHDHTLSTALCKDWLEKTGLSWLLVFDDVSDFDALRPYTPASKHGSIIATTRLPAGDFSTYTTHAVEVHGLELREGAGLFAKFSGDRKVDLKEPVIHELCLKVGGNPLALRQLFMRIMRSEKPLVDLAKQLGGMNSKTEKFGRRTALDLATTTLAFEWMKRLLRSSDMTPEAQDICSVCACLNVSKLAEDYLLTRKSLGKVPLRKLPKSREELKVIFYHTSLQEFLEKEGDHVRMHKVIQQAVRASMTPQAKIDAFNTTSLLLLSRWPSQKKFKNIVHGFWPEFDDLYGHVRVLGELAPTWSCVLESTTGEQLLVPASPGGAFARLLTQSLWYNFSVRGNHDTDQNLLQIADMLYSRAHATRSAIRARATLSKSMPQRLLYIDRGRVSLVEPREPQPYLCVWIGPEGTQSRKLTRSTMNELRNGILLEDLQDFDSDVLTLFDCCFASTIAGVKHLWLDDLCVVQDDEIERATEVGRLFDILSTAQGTITDITKNDFDTSLERSRHLDMQRCRFTSHRSADVTRDWLQQITPGLIALDNRKKWPLALRNSLIAEMRNPERCVEMMKQAWKVGLEASTDQTNRQLEPHTTEGILETATEELTDETQRDVDSKMQPCESKSDVIRSVESCKSCPQNKASVSKAKDLILEAMESLRKKSAFTALGKLQQARDEIHILADKDFEAFAVHLDTSICIAKIFLQQGCPNEAEGVLSCSEAIMKQYDAVSNDFYVARAKLSLAQGDVHKELGNTETANQIYEAIAEYSTDLQESRSDLAAVSKLRLSSIALSNGKATEAHAHLRECISYFVGQDTPQGQIQYARALYHESLIFEGEGKERLRKRSMNSARQALEEVCEELGVELDIGKEKTKEDFETFLDVGYV